MSFMTSRGVGGSREQGSREQREQGAEGAGSREQGDRVGSREIE